MDQLGVNPFALLTFIVAPAILTNASSVLALGTGNRFARAVDRARALGASLAADAGSGKDNHELYLEQLRYAERRPLLLVRALTSFYVSIGSFAAASLVSLLGAVFFMVHHEFLHYVMLAAALFAGVAGVGGLMIGSALLVWDSRIALHMLRKELEYRRRSSASGPA